jgi:hypothetical protein
VQHRDRKVESFIEKVEPKLVQHLESWASLKVDDETKRLVEAQSKAYMTTLLKRHRELNKPKRLPFKKQLMVRNLSNHLGGLMDHNKLEKVAYKIHQQKIAAKNLSVFA